MVKINGVPKSFLAYLFEKGDAYLTKLLYQSMNCGLNYSCTL